MDKFRKRFWKPFTIIVPDHLLRTVSELYVKFYLPPLKICSFWKMRKTIFGCVRYWNLVVLALISIWFLSKSAMFLLHTFDTVVTLLPSTDVGRFRNCFFSKLSLPVSNTNCIHAETSLSFSPITYSSKLFASTSSWVALQLKWPKFCVAIHLLLRHWSPY